MKIQIVKNFIRLKIGMEVDKPEVLANKLIKLGIAKVVSEGKKVIEDLSTKEFKTPDKKKK